MPQKQRLLVIEDDQAIRSLMIAFLEKDEFQAKGAANAAEARSLLQKSQFDMVLIDLGLPDEDGLVLAREIRTRSDVPIVFVTQRSDDADKIAALEMGGDDYVTKPFNPLELTARIRNIFKRMGGGEGNERFHFGDFTLDLPRRSLKSDSGEEIDLTRAEFDLLAALTMANGRVLSRNYLLDAVSFHGEDISDRTVDVLISRIRKKIEPNEKPPKMILTVPGIGYKTGLTIRRDQQVVR